MQRLTNRKSKIQEGAELRTKRLEAGISQRNLALKIASHPKFKSYPFKNICQSTISTYERGETNINPRIARIIEDILKQEIGSEASLIPSLNGSKSYRTLDALSEMELDSRKIFSSASNPKRRMKTLGDGQTVRIFYVSGSTDGVSNDLDMKLNEQWNEIGNILTWQEAMNKVMAGGSVDCEYNGIIHTYTGNSAITINHLKFGSFYSNELLKHEGEVL